MEKSEEQEDGTEGAGIVLSGGEKRYVPHHVIVAQSYGADLSMERPRDIFGALFLACVRVGDTCML